MDYLETSESPLKRPTNLPLIAEHNMKEQKENSKYWYNYCAHVIVKRNCILGIDWIGFLFARRYWITIVIINISSGWPIIIQNLLNSFVLFTNKDHCTNRTGAYLCLVISLIKNERRKYVNLIKLLLNKLLI